VPAPPAPPGAATGGPAAAHDARLTVPTG
jgi:hypothetical protein